MNIGFLGPAVATVLTVYGIETFRSFNKYITLTLVATVLTVYGIETSKASSEYLCCKLQQYLPFTVLKQYLSF